MSKGKEATSFTMLAKLLIVFLIVHLLAVITLILCFSSDHETASVVVPVTSVWCTGDTVERRRCYFKNLCYSFQHQEFVFVRGNESVEQGTPPFDAGPLATPAETPDTNGSPYGKSCLSGHSVGIFGGGERKNERESLRKLWGGGQPLADLSGGVENHCNRDYVFSYVEIPASAIRDKNFTSSILPEKMFIFKRFKPDNLMHVIHDDLMPLFSTLQEFDHAGARDYRIFMADAYDEGDYWDLYRVFRSRTYLNSHHPLTRRSLRAEVDRDADLVCFATAAVGGVANTRWYQYGFDRYQGPSGNRQVTGTEIRAFADYLRKGLEIPKYDIDMPRYGAKVKQRHPYAVLFNRRANRIILNEVDLSMAVAREFNLRTVTVNLETHSLSEIVHLLENATMLIGMHGAQLILSMFLPENSIVLEIFPYGIPSSDYTPYQTLASIAGVNLLYGAYENKDPTKSHAHPEYPVHYGGIRHFSPDKQAEIVANVPVKRHLCCQDAAFLYRMYQDTEVDVTDFIQTAKEVFAERVKRLKRASNDTKAKSRFTPAEVKWINCSFVPTRNVYHLDWEVPWNTALLRKKTDVDWRVRYLVRVQAASGNAVDYEADDSHWEIPGEGDGKGVSVWVAAWLGDAAVLGPWTRNPIQCRR